jgi:hypothetical protein
LFKFVIELCSTLRNLTCETLLDFTTEIIGKIYSLTLSSLRVTRNVKFSPVSAAEMTAVKTFSILGHEFEPIIPILFTLRLCELHP